MNSEYPSIPVDWTLVVDYGVMEESDIPDDMEDDHAPEGPEYAYCDAIRPDNLELRVHIEGDEPEWLQLGEVPVYLAHANDGCSAKGRALFDRIYTKYAAPSDLVAKMPEEHRPWRPESDMDGNSTSASASILDEQDIDTGSTEQQQNQQQPQSNSSSRSNFTLVSTMPKELENAGAPVQAVDAPGTLVFKVMSLIKDNENTTVVPRPRDSSQSYRLQSTLEGSDGRATDDVSWKLVTSRRFHWSTRQRTLPMLSLVIYNKDTDANCGKVNVQLAPLVLHPGQALDAWFPVLLNSNSNSNSNSASSDSNPSTTDTMSVRVVAQFIPDPVPQTSQKSSSNVRKASKTTKLPSWGAGKNESTKAKLLKARTTQVVLKQDPGLNGTRATKRGFDPDQLQLICELGQQLKNAKIHVQIIGLRKCSNAIVQNKKNSKISISCCDLSSDMKWKNVVTSTKPLPPNSDYNTSFLIPMGDNVTTSPVLGFTVDDASSSTGKYSSERAAREWSTVVDIYITPPSFKLFHCHRLVLLYLKHPNKSFFNVINILSLLPHYNTIINLLFYFFRLTSIF